MGKGAQNAGRTGCGRGGGSAASESGPHARQALRCSRNNPLHAARTHRSSRCGHRPGRSAGGAGGRGCTRVQAAAAAARGKSRWRRGWASAASGGLPGQLAGPIGVRGGTGRPAARRCLFDWQLSAAAHPGRCCRLGGPVTTTSSPPRFSPGPLAAPEAKAHRLLRRAVHGHGVPMIWAASVGDRRSASREGKGPKASRANGAGQQGSAAAGLLQGLPGTQLHCTSTPASPPAPQPDPRRTMFAAASALTLRAPTPFCSNPQAGSRRQQGQQPRRLAVRAEVRRRRRRRRRAPPARGNGWVGGRSQDGAVDQFCSSPSAGAAGGWLAGGMMEPAIRRAALQPAARAAG